MSTSSKSFVQKKLGQTEKVQRPTRYRSVVPFISASESLPELTLKAFVLGVILAVVLAGSNAYLGLKMGQTISASIPAAVISMAVLRLFRTSNILENNIVQTIASAGEVVAAAAIFTLPALIILGYWTTFHYWQIVFIMAIGGCLGVLYSVPLRRALIVESELKFPEGLATAEILKAGAVKKEDNTSKGNAGILLAASVGSALVQFMERGLHLLNGMISGWFSVGGSVFGFSFGLTLSMLGAGYIVGIVVALNFIIGAGLVWLVIVPLYASFGGPEAFGLAPNVGAEELAMAIRSTKVRYIGVGTMIFGGLWAIVSLVDPIKTAIASSFHALKQARMGLSEKPIRTDHDIPMTWVLAGVVVLSVPLAFLLNHVMIAADLPLSPFLYSLTLGSMTLAALFIGFICASIGGYMAGIVGSSSNPISGITIGAILIVSFSLVLLLGAEITFGVVSKEVLSLSAIVIIIGAVVASSSALSCDNLQDLKSGQLVGATPWKQQVTLIAGVIAGAVVVAPILQLLYEAYGMGGIFPREGMDPTQGLAAPQAMLMASVAQGVFEHKMDWILVLMGGAIGLVVLLIDKIFLERRASVHRLSIMAVALGIYLPLDVVLPIVTGGFISYFAKRSLAKKVTVLPAEEQEKQFSETERRGVMFSAGLIAGEALIGIILAIPFAAYERTDMFALPFTGGTFVQTATILGTITFAGFAYYLYMLTSKKQNI